MSARRYMVVEQVPVSAWQLQGTLYDAPLQANFAAAKLYSSGVHAGVKVKKISSGWTILFWRAGGYQTIR